MRYFAFVFHPDSSGSMCILHLPHISVVLPTVQGLNISCVGQRRPSGGRWWRGWQQLAAATRDSPQGSRRAGDRQPGWSVAVCRTGERPVLPSQGSSVDVSAECLHLGVWSCGLSPGGQKRGLWLMALGANGSFSGRPRGRGPSGPRTG